MTNGMLRDSAVFSFARYVLLALSFVRNFLIAKILDPESYGYWVIVTLVLTYGDQIHLGLRHAGDKEIPYTEGQGKTDEARKVANTIYAGIVTISMVVLAVLGLFVVVRGSDGGTVEHLILFAGLIVVADQINRYYLMLMRVKKFFVFSSRVEIITEVFRTGLVCVLVYFFAIWGAISGFLAGAMFMAVYSIVHFGKEHVPQMDRRLLMKLLNLGFSLFGMGLLFVLLINSDRLFGATILSKEQLGIYGVAALAAQLPLNFTQGISTVVYPTMSETFGRSNTVMALYPLYANVLRSLSFAAPFVACTTYFATTLMIGLFLPAYRESIDILIVLLPGAFFLSFVPFFSGLFASVNRARHFLLLELFTGVCAFILFPTVQKFFIGPKGVGIAMTAGMLVYAATAIVAAFRLFPISAAERMKQIARTYIPSLYCLVVMGIIVSTIEKESGIAGTLIGYGLFLIASIPLVVIAHRVLDLRNMFKILRSPNG